MRLRWMVAVWFAAGCATAQADSLEINLNDDAVEAAYSTYWRSAELSFGALYHEESEDWVAHAGLLALGMRESPRSRSYVGLGGKLFFASVRDEEILALGLGGLVRWFPGNGPVGVGAALFYAPDVVTGLDGEQFWEFAARLEFEVVKETASLYLGYRKIRAELDNGVKRDVDEDPHLGLHIRF